MNTFESSLLGELQEVVAANPRPQTSTATRTRKWAWVAAPAGVAAAAAGVFATFALQAPGAYAVTKQADGVVKVKITHLSDASGLQKALKADGIDAHVDYKAGGAAPGASDGGRVVSGTVSGTSADQAPVPPGGQVMNGNGAAFAQTGCGDLGLLTVSSSEDAVTFNIPAKDVGKAPLYITMSGDQAGLRGLQAHWAC